MKRIITVFLILLCSRKSSQLQQPADLTLAHQINELRTQMEQFNVDYITNMQEHLFNLMSTVVNIDSSVKNLQEKTKSWDKLHDNIGAWNKHIKSIDEKVKNTYQPQTTSLDTRMENLEFTVKHIFDKVDLINEKLHDFTKIVYRDRRNENEILNKLTLIHAHLMNQHHDGAKSLIAKRDFEMDVDVVENIPTKKLKEIIATRKQERSVENLMSLFQPIEDRTKKIYDLEVNQFEQLQHCCLSTGHELTKFANRAENFFQQIEELLLNNNCTITSSVRNSTQSENEIGSGENSNGNFDIEKTIVKELENPKIGCHKIRNRKSGIYSFNRTIDSLGINGNFLTKRYCLFATDGPAWTLIQKRDTYDLQENFNRSWNDYKFGFGKLNHEFWIGNYHIHRLTLEDNMELRIELENFGGQKTWAEYKTFRIDSEKFNYNLNIGDYSGNASDSMRYHNNLDFSTFDRRHDKSGTNYSCALSYGSGWWFDNCCESNLNGIYFNNPKGHKYRGILWESWLGDYSLKSSKMMIRPKDAWYENYEEFLEATVSIPDDP
uniref:Putative ficolin n=1 Tax=Corethrella appendiculata TaxID=1370023 RepID=U5ET44_9DIPT